MRLKLEHEKRREEDEYEEKGYICHIDIPLSQLERIADSLYTGIHGNIVYPPISPNHPEKRDAKYFASFLELQEQFGLVAELVQDADLIAVISHNIWCILPVNALLLPHIWKKGKHLGLIYAPGVDIIETIRQRRSVMGMPEYRKTFLVTDY